MKTICALCLSGILFAAGAAVADTPTTDDAILAMGAYVPPDDMATSEAFYQTLFNRPPVIALEDFIAFDIEGGWFAIVSRAEYAPGSVPGTGSVPYLQSADLEDLRTRIARTGHSVPEIINEPGIQLLKVVDPNGQLVEFFKLEGQ